MAFKETDEAMLKESIAQDNFGLALDIITKGLANNQDCHWLWARRSMCARFAGQKKRALRYATKAIGLEPSCPLAQWEMAASLEANEIWSEAIEVYSSIIMRGVEGLSSDNCSEGVSESRGIIADCWHYKSLCLLEVGRFTDAERCFKAGLRFRRRGQPTVMPAREAKAQYSKLKAACEVKFV